MPRRTEVYFGARGASVDFRLQDLCSGSYFKAHILVGDGAIPSHSSDQIRFCFFVADRGHGLLVTSPPPPTRAQRRENDGSLCLSSTPPPTPQKNWRAIEECLQISRNFEMNLGKRPTTQSDISTISLASG